ncbi:MAG: hypothetical protein ACFBSE_16015 [Prochloraceae cyanobacterium]
MRLEQRRKNDLAAATIRSSRFGAGRDDNGIATWEKEIESIARPACGTRRSRPRLF